MTVETRTHLSPVQKQDLATQLVAEVKQLLHNEVDNAYDLGTHLNRLHQNELFRSTGAKGWPDFLDQQVQLGRTQAEKWMRVASHFSQQAVETYGVEVLAVYAQLLDRGHAQAPADLTTATIATPDGDKKLDALTEAELKAAAKRPGTPGVVPPADASVVAGITQTLAATPSAHLGAVASKAGTRITITCLLEDRAVVGAALAGGAPAITPSTAKKPAKAKKPAAKKATKPAKKPAKKSKR